MAITENLHPVPPEAQVAQHNLVIDKTDKSTGVVPETSAIDLSVEAPASTVNNQSATGAVEARTGLEPAPQHRVKGVRRIVFAALAGLGGLGVGVAALGGGSDSGNSAAHTTVNPTELGSPNATGLSKSSTDATPHGLNEKMNAPSDIQRSETEQIEVVTQLVEKEDGFLVPAERPEPNKLPPKIISSNDPKVVLKQLADTLAYISTSGDTSYLEYALVDSNSPLGEIIKTNVRNGEIARTQYGINDFFYWESILPDGNVQQLNPSSPEVVLPVKDAVVTYGGEIDTPHSERFTKYDFTLTNKTVTIDGQPKEIRVIKYIGPAKSDVYNNLSSLFSGSSYRR